MIRAVNTLRDDDNLLVQRGSPVVEPLLLVRVRQQCTGRDRDLVVHPQSDDSDRQGFFEQRLGFSILSLQWDPRAERTLLEKSPRTVRIKLMQTSSSAAKSSPTATCFAYATANSQHDQAGVLESSRHSNEPTRTYPDASNPAGPSTSIGVRHKYRA